MIGPIDWFESKLPQNMRNYINVRLELKRKHGYLFFGTLLFVFVGFWNQTSAQAHITCENTNESRHNLKVTLLFIVDISDVLPGDKGAMNYTNRRVDFINSLPTLQEKSC